MICGPRYSSCDGRRMVESCDGSATVGLVAYKNVDTIEINGISAYDYRMREPGVMGLALARGSGSQVIVLHGLTSPCTRFRRSENTSINVVLARVGQYPGQSKRTSRSHYLLKRVSRKVNLLIPHLHIVLACRADVSVTGQLLHYMQRNSTREIRAVAFPKIVERTLRNSPNVSR